MFGMYLGVRLGYYRALSESGPVNSLQLAGRTGTRTAGFDSVEILPIENYFFRFYRLIP